MTPKIWVDYNAWGRDDKGYFIILEKKGTIDSLTKQKIKFETNIRAIFYSDDSGESEDQRYFGGIGYIDFNKKLGQWVAYIAEKNIIYTKTLDDLEKQLKE